MKIFKFPLTCDECKLPINNVIEGMVEWIDDDVTISDVRIIHNPKFSNNTICYKHSLNYHRQDAHLESILENQALQKKLGIKIFL